MNEKNPQFGAFVNSSTEKKSGAYFENQLADKQESASSLEDKALVILNGRTIAENISLPDKYIRDGHRSVQPILDALKKNNGHISYFDDEELCAQFEEKYGLSEPAMVLAIAMRLHEKALTQKH